MYPRTDTAAAAMTDRLGLAAYHAEVAIAAMRAASRRHADTENWGRAGDAGRMLALAEELRRLAEAA